MNRGKIQGLKEYIEYCKKQFAPHLNETHIWWYEKAMESCKSRLLELENSPN